MTKTETKRPIEVTAIEKGYYGNQIRRPGDRFEIDTIEHFSIKWMQSDDPRVLDLVGGK